MKAFLCLALISLALSNRIVNQKFVEHLKKVAPFEVTDPSENKFRDWTDEEISSMLGLLESPESLQDEKKSEVKLGDVPQFYDFRKEHPKCMLGIRDQGKCGACWAFAGVEALQERFCLQGGENVMLSAQDSVSCDPGEMGCMGGWLDKAWQYFVQRGVVNEACFPYTSQWGAVETCLMQCKNGKPWDKYKAKSFAKFSGVDEIKNEVYNNGPLETGFDVYSDFMDYKSGIYEHVTGGREGMHAVVIVGWGEEEGKSYWICQNSWNENWGESGYFRIKMGEVKIDEAAYGGPADVKA